MTDRHVAYFVTLDRDPREDATEGEALNDHACDAPDDPAHDSPREWTCPACRAVWERIEHSEDEGEIYETWFERRDDGPCQSCERCTWNQGGDCVKADHVHCPTCSHCVTRHAEQRPIWRGILTAMLDQHMRAEPVVYPPGIVGFEAAMTGPASYRLTAKTAAGETVVAEGTLEP